MIDYLNKSLVGFVVLCFIGSDWALVPTVCVYNATNSGVCCPAPKYSSEICGGPKRGECRTVRIPHEIIPEIFTFDDRVEWPKRFFHKMCDCKGNFFGIACDECWYGWEGKNCDIKQKRIRKNMKYLSKRDRNILRHVVDRSLYVDSHYSVYIDRDNARHDPILKPIKWLAASVQYMFVFIHRFGSRPTMFEDYLDCQNFGILNFNHDGVAFVTWHRYYMLHWERELEKIARREFGVREFVLPYWDWVNLKECDICNDEFVGGLGQEDRFGMRISRGSPYSNWTEFCVEPNDALENPCYGCHVTGNYGRLTRAWNSYAFPTITDVEYVFSKRPFHLDDERPGEAECRSFSRAIEGFCGNTADPNNLFWMHNKVHNMIDGSMCCVGSAPSDPIFIYHHIMIDRMFEEYLNRYNVPITEYPELNTRPGHGRDVFMIAILPLARHSQMWVPSYQLGYRYDNFQFGRGNGPESGHDKHQPDSSKRREHSSRKDGDDDNDFTALLDELDIDMGKY